MPQPNIRHFSEPSRILCKPVEFVTWYSGQPFSNSGTRLSWKTPQPQTADARLSVRAKRERKNVPAYASVEPNHPPLKAGWRVGSALVILIACVRVLPVGRKVAEKKQGRRRALPLSHGTPPGQGRERMPIQLPSNGLCNRPSPGAGFGPRLASLPRWQNAVRPAKLPIPTEHRTCRFFGESRCAGSAGFWWSCLPSPGWRWNCRPWWHRNHPMTKDSGDEPATVGSGRTGCSRNRRRPLSACIRPVWRCSR